MHLKSDIRYFALIYMTILWLTELIFRRYAKRGINGVAGHDAILLMRTHAGHPTAFQIIQWIQLNYSIQSNYRSEAYKDHKIFPSRQGK
jgi:hypothetical protein